MFVVETGPFWNRLDPVTTHCLVTPGFFIFKGL